MRSLPMIAPAAAVFAALLWLAGAGPAAANDAEDQAHGEPRVELTFGRSEDYDYDPPAPGSYRLPALKPAADGTVLTPDGAPRSLHALMDDRITVLAFIYTRCSAPKGCPLSLGLLYDLQYIADEDPAIGRNLRLIALSFDPAHDTPEIMAKYGGRSESEGSGRTGPLFLTTASETALRPILEAYDQPVGRKADPEDSFGPLTHQLRVFLIDREKRVRNIYSLGFLDPRLVATDVRTLLLEERA